MWPLKPLLRFAATDAPPAGERTGALLAAVRDVLYPPLCLACGAAAAADRDLCETCASRVAWAAGRDCPVCGRVLGPHAARRRCLDCRGRTFAFRRAYAAAAYAGPVRDVVLRMKRRRQAFLARRLAGWLVARLAEEGIADAVDAVAAVPAHWTAFLARGFNPAAILAHEVARGIGRPYAAGILRRRRLVRRRQRGLSRAARFANVTGAFIARRPGLVAGRRFLIVDDVMTTGATLDACARALAAAGASRVLAAVVGRTS